MTTREDYNKHGYIIKRGFFPKKLTDAIQAEYKEIFELELKTCGLPLVSFETTEGFGRNLQTLFDYSVERYINCCRLSQHTFAVHRISLWEGIEQLLHDIGLDSPVINSRPVCHFTNNTLVIPGGYHKSPPHQDWRSMQGSLDGVVVWVPLTDVDINGHPVEIVPGSHKLGLLETRDHVATPEVIDPRIRDEDYIPALCEVGDVVAFSSFLVHRSMQGCDDKRLRMAVSLRYNNIREKTFVERGYPNPYKYSYQLKIMFPELNTQSGVKDIFG